MTYSPGKESPQSIDISINVYHRKTWCRLSLLSVVQMVELLINEYTQHVILHMC